MEAQIRDRGTTWEPPPKWWTEGALLGELLGGAGRSNGMPTPQRGWTSERGIKQGCTSSRTLCWGHPAHRGRRVHVLSTSCLGKMELTDTQLCLVLYLEPSKYSAHSTNE